jgi:ankyrin repeat protein
MVVTIAVAATCLCNGLGLIEAVKTRDHKALEAIIKSHADVNVAQPDGATALAWAVFIDDREAAEMLLAAGARVNTADEYGETPLTLACGTGNVALVRRLLAAGANASAARWDGSTALMIAANSGRPEAVKLLIEHGANVNAVEKKKGQTALMWAAAEAHSDVVQLLVDNGADVKTVSKGGFTPLVFASIKNDWKSVKTLLAAGADPNTKIPDETPVVILAAANRSSRSAELLIDAGADPKSADRRGNTMLHTAAQIGDGELVKKLLAKGADVNARNAKVQGRTGPSSGGFRPIAGEITPVHVAARANQLGIMKLLVAAGADPKVRAEDGTTLLMAAANSTNVKVVEYAYELDPDVKAVTQSGATVVHAAVTGVGPAADQAEICKVIQFLAEKGAPLDERNANGRTPIDIADILPLDQAVDLLTQLITKSGATPKTRTKR